MSYADPSSHPLASVGDSYNAVFVNGDAVENAMFSEEARGAFYGKRCCRRCF